MTITITRENPTSADLSLLFERHTAAMHFDTPPESIHMMDAGELDHPDIFFFVMREDGRPIGMGAFKRHDSTLGEIKSMHVLHELRGRGLSRQMLSHLMEQAKAAGLSRLSLETGTQASFIAAKMLYAKAGFAECAPFADYRLDPNSLYMTRLLE